MKQPKILQDIKKNGINRQQEDQDDMKVFIKSLY